MQQLRLPLAFVLLAIALIAGCDKGEPADTTPPPPGGKRMSLDEAEKVRPKQRGGAKAAEDR